jgi:hypothetical protein
MSPNARRFCLDEVSRDINNTLKGIKLSAGFRILMRPGRADRQTRHRKHEKTSASSHHNRISPRGDRHCTIARSAVQTRSAFIVDTTTAGKVLSPGGCARERSAFSFGGPLLQQLEAR